MDSSEVERLAASLAAFPWVWTRSELEAANLRATSGYRDVTENIGKFNLDAGHMISARFRGDNVVRYRVTLKISQPANELSEVELETTYGTYRNDFTQLCTVFPTTFGNPEYSGERDTPSFPEGEYCAFLAIWDLPKFKLRVEVEDEQEDSPLQLLVYITPAH